jgi:hypothetical protein
VRLENPYRFFPSDDSFDAEVNPELLEQVLDEETLARVYARMEAEGAAGYGFEVMQALRSCWYSQLLLAVIADAASGVNSREVRQARPGAIIRSSRLRCVLATRRSMNVQSFC